MILPSRTTLILVGLLAVSAAGNVALVWKLAQAKPECESTIASKTLDSVNRVQVAAGNRDKVSREITRQSDDRAIKASTESDLAVQTHKGEIEHAYAEDRPDASRDVGCTVLRPVPDRVQHAIESAAARTNRR